MYAESVLVDMSIPPAKWPKLQRLIMMDFSTYSNIFYWNILKINTLNMPKVKSFILGELVLSFVANKKRVTVLRDRLWALVTWEQNIEMTSNFFMLVISIVSQTYFKNIIIRCLFLVLVFRWRHMKTKNRRSMQFTTIYYVPEWVYI